MEAHPVLHVSRILTGILITTHVQYSPPLDELPTDPKEICAAEQNEDTAKVKSKVDAP